MKAVVTLFVKNIKEISAQGASFSYITNHKTSLAGFVRPRF
jgi:hypothetical protein